MEIYVIICNGISDIGKGWLTSAIGALAPKRTLPIKIDPLLNTGFPPHLGVSIGDICSPKEVRAFLKKTKNSEPFLVSDDLKLYSDAGMSVYPECNFVAGDLWKRFLADLDAKPKFIREDEYKKVTFNDLSFFLANQITQIVRNRKPERVLIEIGGTVDDRESIYLPAAIRYLSLPELLDCTPEIVLLSYLDYSESEDAGYRIKTQYVRHGIVETMRSYHGLPLRACFVRRRGVPETISDTVIEADLKNVAFETQIHPSKIFLLPNITKYRLPELTKRFEQQSIFGSSSIVKKPCLVSACLLGVPCQWDGTVASRLLPDHIIKQFNLIPVCPEQLGGLPTPRKPAEIVSGDGANVLAGNHHITTRDGVDLTENFLIGAHHTLNIAQRCRATRMIAQRRSPSCSCKMIYDGTFSKSLKAGVGVTAALLRDNGIEIWDIESFDTSQEVIFEAGR